MVIQEGTKHTEEKEEAGYRSSTWSIVRINKAKRLQGEAVMSTPPFFQSAARGNLIRGCMGKFIVIRAGE